MNRFQTTRWSLVLEASADNAQSRRALEDLCRCYRAPILAYVRGRGYPAEEAEDLTQAFFARFIERAAYAHADPARGRFRAFLLTALKHFLSDAADHARARKRGGHAPVRSFDAADGDSGIEIDAAADTPERAFDRAWAHAVLQAALGRLRAEAGVAGKTALFDHLCEFLIEPPDEADYQRVAEALNLRRNTLAVAVHRLRHRLRELVCEELADTAAGAADLERELDDLRECLGAVIP